jgi:hypothetical protein
MEVNTKNTMTFQDCLLECCQNDELVAQFNRLQGTNLSFKDKRAPIEVMVDKATGYPYPFHNKPEEMRRFISFCFEYVWLPLKYE